MAVTVSIGANQSIATVTPASSSGSGPWVITFTSTPSSDVAVGDIFVIQDEVASMATNTYLVTAISGSNYTLKYLDDGGSYQGDASPYGNFYTMNYETFEPEQASGIFKRCYTTIIFFEAGLNDSDLYSSGDDIVGELHDDGDFTETNVIFNYNTNINSIKLTAYSADRHLGVIGATGKVIWKPTANNELINLNVDNITVSWIEFDFTNFTNYVGIDVTTAADNIYVTNNILHSMPNQSFNLNPLRFQGHGYIMNNMIYNMVDAGDWSFGINLYGSSKAIGVYNNTIYKITNTGGDEAAGIRTNDSDHLLKNNLVMTVTGGVCYWNNGGVSTSSDYNIGTDTTANSGFGSNSVNSAVLANTFEEYGTATATDFLRLKTGSAAIGVSEDLVTTPVGVNIDLNGFDRNSAAVDWDAGCFQFTTAAASTGSPAAFLLFLD
jgi:hypothetical protein